MVAYAPVGIDEKDVLAIIAYDRNGNQIVLDPNDEPDMPVVVVGINERVKKGGKYYLPPSCEEGCGGSGGGSGDPVPSGPRTNGALETMQKVKMHNLSEPWWKGSAELVLKIATTGFPDGLTHQTFNIDRNDEDDWVRKNRNLYNWWQDNYGTLAIFYWYEDDSDFLSGTITWKATWTWQNPATNSTVTTEFRIKLNDDDDKLGWAPVDFRDSYRVYQTGDVSWYEYWSDN